MSDKPFICGTIYWPLLPLGILRSELVPFLSSKDLEKEKKIICPFISNAKCMNSGNVASCFINNKDKDRDSCCYYNYHRFFLLLRNDVAFPICKEYDKKINDKRTTYSELYHSDISAEDFSNSLCYFPQYKIKDDELKGFEFVGKGLPKDVFFRCSIGNKHLVYAHNLDQLQSRANFYAKSERHLCKDMTAPAMSSSAFNKLINIDAVKSRLPKDKFAVILEGGEQNGDPVYPVVLSFFADKSPDVLLSLIVKNDEKKTASNITKKLIEQALGSIHNEIYKQRQEFLEKWCMTLGERVDGICQKQIIDMSDKTDSIKYASDDEKRQKDAKRVAMQFAFDAILKMAIILAAQTNTASLKIDLPSLDFDPGKDHPGQIMTCIEKYINQFKKQNLSSDRRKYITNFCEKAEMYAEEFVASEGKLKGRLSAPTVRELKKISLTSDPVNARILIRGEPGGGKGVTAEDFHFYCMKRIAEEIKDEEDGLVKIIGKKKTEHNRLKCEMEEVILLTESCDFLKKIRKKLESIFSLPTVYKSSGAGARANFCLSQISNTGWWLWNRGQKVEEGIPPDKSTNLSNSLQDLHDFRNRLNQNIPLSENDLKAGIEKEAENVSSAEERSEYYLILLFIKLLKDRILLELSSKKPKWSFNMLQVNCGILGGENSELAESIERLFGTSGELETAMPGLFQTCSYMGGTLFLDEIADAPVRVQDNLLRPLEEEKVSRPGWETFDENVDNIRIVGATFKDLFKLAQQYQETLPSGNPKGFRPDLLTRLTRNTPVSVTPVSQYFVPTKQIDDDFKSQFAFVCNSTWVVSTPFWGKVYDKVFQKIDEHVHKARYHIPDVLEGRRKFASKITMRLFKEVGKIAQLNNNPKLPDNNFTRKNKALEYLDRMLDYLLVETS